MLIAYDNIIAGHFNYTAGLVGWKRSVFHHHLVGVFDLSNLWKFLFSCYNYRYLIKNKIYNQYDNIEIFRNIQHLWTSNSPSSILVCINIWVKRIIGLYFLFNFCFCLCTYCCSYYPKLFGIFLLGKNKNVGVTNLMWFVFGKL